MGDFFGPLPPERQSEGVWLVDAWKIFGSKELDPDWQSAALRFSEIGDGDTVDFYAASSRFADLTLDVELRDRFHGGQQDAWIQYCRFRNAVQLSVVARLQFAELRAYGAKGSTAGDVEWIPPIAWMDLNLIGDKRNVVQADGISYWHVRVVDPNLRPQDTPAPDELLEVPASLIVDAPTSIGAAKRGPRPVTYEAAHAAVMAALDTGAITMTALMTLRKKQMPVQFPGFKDGTLWKVRNNLKTLNNSARTLPKNK